MLDLTSNDTALRLAIPSETLLRHDVDTRFANDGPSLAITLRWPMERQELERLCAIAAKTGSDLEVLHCRFEGLPS